MTLPNCTSSDEGPATGDESSAEEQYDSLTQFLRAYPDSATDVEFVAELLRGADWPAEAMWPELWSLLNRRVLTPDVVAKVIMAVGNAQPQLARLAVVGDPGDVGLRIVSDSPAVWASLPDWAVSDQASTERIGRLLAALAQTHTVIAGQVIAAMAPNPQRMALLLGAAALPRHPRGTEALAGAIAGAGADVMGLALATWCTADSAATEPIASALAFASRTDVRKAAEVLLSLAAVAPAGAAAVWLAWWARSQGRAMQTLLVVAPAQAAWAGRVLAQAVATGVSVEALVSWILHFDPQGLPLAARVVLHLAAKPAEVVGLLDEPLEPTSPLVVAVVAALAAAPAVMAPVVTTMLDARRTAAAAELLTRIAPQAAAAVLGSAQWDPVSFARLLSRIQADHPAALNRLLPHLTPATLGPALAQSRQWPQLAVLIDRLGPDAAALLLAAISVHDPAGANEVLDSLTGAMGPDGTRDVLAAACLRHTGEMQPAVTVMAGRGARAARALLVETLVRIPSATAAELFVGTVATEAVQAADGPGAMDTSAALLIAVHHADPARAAHLLAHTLGTASHLGRDLCVWMVEHGADTTAALSHIVAGDHEFTAAVISVLVVEDPDGHLLKRLLSVGSAVLSPAVLQLVTVDPPRLARLVASLHTGGGTDLARSILAGLPAPLAADVVIRADLLARTDLLDALLSTDGTAIRRIAAAILATKPDATSTLLWWLLLGERPDKLDVLMDVLSPRAIAGSLPHLTPGVTAQVFGHVRIRDAARLGEALTLAVDSGSAYSASSALMSFVPDDAADLLAKAHPEAAKRILDHLKDSRLIREKDFLRTIAAHRPELLGYALSQLPGHTVARTVLNLDAELLQAVPEGNFERIYTRLGANHRRDLLAALGTKRMSGLAEYLRSLA
ncbi:hypothetical protein [Amycolatopsis sp. cmx-4-61]|uniref:hypothetical protein n=1 Tax=Amycolatopsis sp. cmx-4-61 TaxID=2790937 RepID=UPI00397DA656